MKTLLMFRKMMSVDDYFTVNFVNAVIKMSLGEIWNTIHP